MSEKTYDELVEEGLDAVAANMKDEGSTPWSTNDENLRGIRHVMNAQLVMAGALLAQLRLMDERLETVELAVSRFDQRERYG